MPIEKCLKVAALASAALVAAAAPSRSDDLIKPRLDVNSAFCAGTGDCAVSVFAGPRLDTHMVSVFGISNFVAPTRYQYGNSWITGGTFSRRLLSVGPVDFEGEVGAGKRWGSLGEGEGWLALYGRWTWFPWNEYVRTTVAVSTGLTLATGNPRYEVRREGVKGAYVLHYLSPEITFAPPKSQWEGFLRLHHRSGGGDFIGDTSIFKGASGGAQYLVSGIRYRF